MAEEQQWVRLGEACQELQVKYHVLWRLISQAKAEVRQDPRDARSKYVDIIALRKHMQQAVHV
jgi:hypothetical protein